ncbi:MAG TPA: MFS transporter [Anaerolineales bacterium]
MQLETEPIPKPAPARLYYGWVVLAVCVTVIAFVSPVIPSFSLFYVAVLKDFAWNRGSLAIAMSIHLVLIGTASPFAGGLIDRFDPRRVMPFGALITGVALICLSRGTTLWHFYVAFGVLAAIGSALLHVVPLTTIVSNWFVVNRGTAIGIVTAGSGAGQLLLLPLIEYLIHRVGWRNTYLALGATIMVIPTALILLFLYRRPQDRGFSAADEIRFKKRQAPIGTAPKDGRADESPEKELIIFDKTWTETDWTIRKAIRTFRFWAIALVMAMFGAGFFITSVHLVAYLLDKGYSSILAASIVGLQGFITIIGTIAGGALSDRVGREKTLTVSIAVFILCIVLLNLCGVIVSPILVYAFAVLYGMGYGMAQPALMASAADLFEGQHFGSILGIIILGAFGGGAIGTWLGGYFFDLTQGYQLNFLVAAATMFVSAALIWIARPSQVRIVRTAPAS